MSNDIPATTLSLLHKPAGSLSLTTLAVPSPLPNEHLVLVKCTSLTNGELKWPEPQSVPEPVPGYDVAGTVLNSVENSPFKPGDEVYGLTSFNRAGAARRYQIALPSELALRPRKKDDSTTSAVSNGFTWEEAATVPLSALTGWQALFVHGRLAEPVQDGREMEDVKEKDKGKRVLVTGAAGGVGLWVVQLAKEAGCHVVATCGSRNREFVVQLGADEVVTYDGEGRIGIKEWTNKSEERKFDVVVDCVGGNSLEQAWCTVKKGGFITSVAEPSALKKPKEGVEDSVRDHWFIVEAESRQLEEITRLIETGRCRPVLDSVFQLEEWEKAFEKLSQGHARGKIVLNIQ